MALRSVYTGRSNEGTLTAVEALGCLYIAYASGQEIVVHSDTGAFVQSISHALIASPISHLAACADGRLAAAAGHSITVFQPQIAKHRSGDNESQRAPIWVYESQFDVRDGSKPLEGGTALALTSVSACAWMDGCQLLIGTAAELSLWALGDDGVWSRKWSWLVGGPISKIAAIFGASVFATSSSDSRMVKIWQLLPNNDYVRFQYVVHTDRVRDIFWRKQAISSEQPLQSITLYTLTDDQRINTWHSRRANDFSTLGCTDNLDLRFGLLSTIDLCHAAADNGARASTDRKLVSAGIYYHQIQKPEIDIQDISLAQPSNPRSTHASAISLKPSEPGTSNPSAQLSAQPSKASSLSGYASTASKHSTSLGQTSNYYSSDPAASDPESDYVCGIYSDGSMTVWKIARSNKPNVFCRAVSVLETSSTESSTTLPLPSNFNGNSIYQSLLWMPKSTAIREGSEEIQSWRLALSDSVGHIFLLRVPLPKADLSAEQQTIELLSLWDGHREPIFHISVDPFSERVATHSTEGELLIWDKVDIGRGRRQSISRKMDLDDSNIRTIAWAPTESEFIAATSKKVYRMMYDAHAEVWSPCSASLPNIKPYDRIFTYPANPIDTIQESHHKPSQRQPYYISTVDSKSKTVQTWYVPSSENGIEFVNSTTLSTGPRFDRVSRVMPVPYPFFSRDNIMATFDTESGKLRIWGIRTSPDLFWFCSKEHRLPCMNVEMIRYNSIDKAAIVSTEADGSVIVTVWVFSSASRASHYLPAGTIYPRSKTDRVREIRWHLTDYAQTYLGIQWDDRIDIYCQERNVDDAWMRVFTISASDFGPEKKIGSFSFTAAGEPTFSIGCKMIACTQTISDGRQLEQVAYEEHGQLPLIHPFVLTELMSWGRVDVAKRLLAQLYDYMREKAIDGTRKVALPTVSMQDLVSPVDSSNSRGAFSGLGSTKKGASGIMSRYSALFGASAYDDATQGLDAETPDFSQLTRDKADYILEKLAEIKIEGISPIDQARLMSIVGTISASLTKDQPIDEMGIRYLVKLQLLELENKRTRSAEGLPYRELNWAMHSSSQAIILQLCLQQQQQQHSSFTGLTWDSARRMGLFVWLSDISVLVSEVEKMARNMFVVEGRDPSRCGIFYLALRKQRLLHGLWRTAHTHAEHSKMVAFMAHDFSEQRWKTAAAKNAYVLLSRQRYLDAATFFLLSDKLSDAATICITQLKDVQMAITICRCYEGDNGPVLKSLLWKHVLPDAFKRQDRWLASLAFGLIGKYDLVLQSLTDDLARLAKQVDVCAEISGYSTMDVLDTELLILYRSMLNHSPYYRAPLVTQAELIAQTITIFECLGAPVMSLVVLEWWRRELFEISKRSQPTLKTLGRSSTLLSQSADSPTTDSLSSGVLDPGAMGIFAGFSSTGSSKPPPAPPKQPAAADPLSSGMLSMDSFGSMFSGRGASRPKASKEPANADALALPQQKQQSQNGNHASAPRDDAQDAALAVDIEDTPVQYACRTALALQIIEFVVKSAAFSKKCSTPRAFEIAKEKQAVAKTLRLPLSVFPTSS